MKVIAREVFTNYIIDLAICYIVILNAQASLQCPPDC